MVPEEIQGQLFLGVLGDILSLKNFSMGRAGGDERGVEIEVEEGGQRPSWTLESWF